MPFRSPKMNSFIFGFQRFVWWPKCTPASSRSFIAIPGKVPPCPLAPADLTRSALQLTFTELEALARASQAVLLAFLDARVRREQPVLLQLLAKPCVVLDERPRNCEAYRAGLAVFAAAGHRREDVELVAILGQQQRAADLRPQRIGREVLIELSVVDGDGALAGAEEDA